MEHLEPNSVTQVSTELTVMWIWISSMVGQIWAFLTNLPFIKLGKALLFIAGLEVYALLSGSDS